MTITRDQELWALALWVEREHGDDGDRFIADRVVHFEETGEAGGQELWMEVARRYFELTDAQSAQLN